MKAFPIPLVAIGPGSQPAEEPMIVQPYAPMESASRPAYPDTDDAPHSREAAIAIRTLAQQASRRAQGGEAASLPLADLAPATRVLLDQALGEGEVSIIVHAPRRVEIQETAFAGVWRVHTLSETGATLDDRLEVAPVPAAVARAIEAGTSPTFSWGAAPDGVMNAVPMLKEIRARARAWRAGQPPHVINLTLLPVSPEDLNMLNQALGSGPVVMLSRGYGKCRITATAVRNVWLVQYFNLMDTMILNTIEVTDVPEVALAAADDLADACARLTDLAEWLDSEAQRT